MLGHLFLFYGRIGRLSYFLWSWIFVPVIFFLFIIVLSFVLAFGPDFGKSKSVFYMILFLPIVVLFWVELSLQTVRIRDIGWKPGIIIPALTVINVIDLFVAYAFPDLSTETKFHTIIMTIISTIYSLVLLFTPTDGDEMVPFIIPWLSLPKVSLDIFRRNRPEAPVYSKPRLPSEAPPPRYPREKVPFGRRGLT